MRFRFETATLGKVVAFTLISVVLTILLGMRIANLGFFGSTYELQAVFSNATGVFEGDAVKLAGVDVGRVTQREIRNGKAVVTFEVDQDVPLTTDTRIGIRWRNVIGLRYLYVYPGTGGERLPAGALVPDSRTDEAGDIGEFLNHLGPILEAINPDKANAFIDAVNTALAGNENVVRSLLTEGSYLASQLGLMDSEISGLIDSSDEIMAAYASQDDAIGTIIDDLDLLSGELSTMTTDINLLVENFAVVQDQLRQLLQENRGNIDATILGLRDVTRNLALNRKDLAKTLCTLPAGVAPYDMTSSWGEWFNVRITEVTLKDEQGNLITSQREEQEDPGRVEEPFVCSPEQTGGRAAPTAGGSGAGAPADSTGLGPWLDSVIGERADG